MYALTYETEYTDARRVVSVPLTDVNKAGSSNETLRTVLGLETTLPLWAEDRIAEILERFLTERVKDPDVLVALRDELAEAGLHEAVPAVVRQALNRAAQ